MQHWNTNRKRYDLFREGNHAKSAIVAEYYNLLNFQTKHHAGQKKRYQVGQYNGHTTDQVTIKKPKPDADNEHGVHRQRYTR